MCVQYEAFLDGSIVSNMVRTSVLEMLPAVQGSVERSQRESVDESAIAQAEMMSRKSGGVSCDWDPHLPCFADLVRKPWSLCLIVWSPTCVSVALACWVSSCINMSSVIHLQLPPSVTHPNHYYNACSSLLVQVQELSMPVMAQNEYGWYLLLQI